MFYVRALFLEITLLVKRHIGETLYNTERLYSNLLKNYNINPGTGINASSLLKSLKAWKPKFPTVWLSVMMEGAINMLDDRIKGWQITTEIRIMKYYL